MSEPTGSPADTGRIEGIVAVILAAGLSSRMAPQNKLLLDFGGEALVHRLAREALASLAKQVIVVVGHDRWNVRKALADLAVTIVENPDYTESQMTSVRAGGTAWPVPGRDGLARRLRLGGREPDRRVRHRGDPGCRR